MKPSKNAGGIINAHELYRVQTVMELLGVGYKAYTSMRRRGLPVIRIGSRKFISGRQLIEYMERFAHVESQGERDPGEESATLDSTLERARHANHAGEDIGDCQSP